MLVLDEEKLERTRSCAGAELCAVLRSWSVMSVSGAERSWCCHSTAVPRSWSCAEELEPAEELERERC